MSLPTLPLDELDALIREARPRPEGHWWRRLMMTVEQLRVDLRSARAERDQLQTAIAQLRREKTDASD